MKRTALSLTLRVWARQRLGIGLLLAACVGACALVFSLYRLPVGATGYVALLWGVLWALYAVYDCIHFCVRHRQLRELYERVIWGVNALPPPHGLLEADYQALIDVVHRDKIRLISEADSAHSDFLDYFSLWTHQIKTPISALHLLLQSGETPLRPELEMEVFRIEQYVQSALTFLRLQGGSDFVIQRYDLDTIIKQAVRKYAKLFIHKKLRLEYSALHLDVLTDEKWLCFVIEQLLSNAIKYTHSGHIAIRLEEGDRLVIEDTGIGIAPEDLPRLCEKGFTGYNGRSDKKSTGIGLYLCKRILTRLSHTLVIDSQPGHGTRVTVGLSSAPPVVE